MFVFIFFIIFLKLLISSYIFLITFLILVIFSKSSIFLRFFSFVWIMFLMGFLFTSPSPTSPVVVSSFLRLIPLLIILVSSSIFFSKANILLSSEEIRPSEGLSPNNSCSTFSHSSTILLYLSKDLS